LRPSSETGHPPSPGSGLWHTAESSPVARESSRRSLNHPVPGIVLQQLVVVPGGRLWPVIPSQGPDLDRFTRLSFPVSFRLQEQAHGFHIETTHFQSLFDRHLQLRVAVLPAQQEHLDHGPCCGLLAPSLLQHLPVAIKTDRPTSLCPPLLERCRTRERSGLLRQCLQVFSLQMHPGTNRLGPLADQTLLILPGCFQQEEVQRFPAGNLRNRHHVVPAKVSAFSFHSTLLVAFCRGAKLRLETPMRSEGYESRGLLSLVPSQNLLHRTLKVVVP